MVDEGNALEFLHDIVQFRVIGLQELAARRNIIEQVSHLEVGPHGTHTGFLAQYLAALYLQARAEFGIQGAGLQRHLRHGHDRRQGLAAETHGAEREKVLGTSDLTGGMAFESQAGIRFTHALTIVYHLNASASCILDIDINIACPGIHGILHQLLYDGSRTLYDFSGGYLIGHGVGQKVYNIQFDSMLH